MLLRVVLPWLVEDCLSVFGIDLLPDQVRLATLCRPIETETVEGSRRIVGFDREGILFRLVTFYPFHVLLTGTFSLLVTKTKSIFALLRICSSHVTVAGLTLWEVEEAVGTTITLQADVAFFAFALKEFISGS